MFYIPKLGEYISFSARSRRFLGLDRRESKVMTNGKRVIVRATSWGFKELAFKENIFDRVNAILAIRFDLLAREIN